MSILPQGFKDLIPEDSEAILNTAMVLNNDKLVIIRSRDVKDEMTIHDLHSGEQTGRIGEGMIGTFAEVTGKREHQEFFYKVVGFNNPGLIYRYSFKESEKQEKLFRKTDVKGLRPEEFFTEQVFIESTGGVKVPMFITTPAGVPKDGTAGALLYAYGGFSIPMDPSFSPAMLTFCKYYGCAFAVVNARGGGEYGEEWHEAGILEHKQNVGCSVHSGLPPNCLAYSSCIYRLSAMCKLLPSTWLITSMPATRKSQYTEGRMEESLLSGQLNKSLSFSAQC